MEYPSDPISCHSTPLSGLTTVIDPEQASLDIIFVHGFTGHPERTWTHKKGDERQRTYDGNEAQPPSKIQKISPFFKSHQKSSPAPIFWPRHLVPSTLPNARVLTYGYDTHIRHKVGGPSANRDTVYDIAWDFLVALEAQRRAEPSRPAIFVVHSLGGIVVKELLRRSSGCPQSQVHLRSIFESTIGIMFFGTPHSGADPRGILQHIAEKVIKATGFSVNEQVVNTLLPSAERLRELRNEFGPIADKQNWIIHSFQEQHGIALLGGRKVVEDTSSCLNLPANETTEHIGRNHMEMCRFTGLDDVEYRKVASALRKIASSVSSRFRKGEKLPLNDEQRKTLLESLRFEQIDARQMTIKNAHTKTCRWLLDKSEYIDWLDPAKLDGHHGFLWIKGKPGTGKSTLIKFALAHARRRMNDRITISFFFNARGEGLEKSTLGTYQSLLLQLFERLPALQSVFDYLDLSTWSISANRRWTIESLKSLFEQAIQSLGDSFVVCFIDALDECNESQIREMLSFFEHISELAVSIGAKFLVCFSSRHYPNIEIRRGLGLVLEGQEGHNQDIINYLDSELRIGHNKIAEQIRIDLKEKASGVFMWVVLVVEILNKEHDGGRIHALQRRLKEIPGDLHDLFCDMLTRDSDNKDELILCIQWVLFAKQPLGPEQLYFAILSGVESQTLSRWDSDEISSLTIKRFILNSSKGLAEITTSKTSRVQFIHESVRDFLLKENGLSKVWSDLGTNFQGQSHERLKQCCLNYMNIDFSTYPEISNPPVEASSQEAATIRKVAACMFPFLDYAIRHVLYHADVAEGCGIAQGRFIQSFRLKDWIKLDNLFEKHKVRRHTQDASLLYILAEGNMPNLIKVHPSVLSSLEVENERYGTPLLASLATRSEDAVRAFIKAYAAAQFPGSQSHGLYLQDYSDANKQRNIGRDYKFLKRRTVLSYLAEYGEGLLLSLILQTGKFTPDFKDDIGRTPLWWAAKEGREAIVKLLLETGKVEVDSKDNNGRTPLWWAAKEGREAVVKLLLETGKAEVDLKDDLGLTPLWLAIRNGHEAIVELLLETGKVEVDSKDDNSLTPLWLAIRNGHEAIVELLLETGKVEVDSKDDNSQTPLSWAAGNGHEAVVKLLLETGKVEIDLKDNNGRTPLFQAALNGHKATFKLLLETGKVEIDLKDNNGRTPLSQAALNGHKATVELLLETGKVEVDSKDNLGLTPLWWAALNGHEATVELLLETGKVEVDSKDNNGLTPLWWAALNGHEAIVELLLETGKVEIDLKDNNSRTPLSQAALNGHEAIVKLLLETGKVEVDSKDNNGRTPLWWAAKEGREAVVKLLLETGKAEVDLKDDDNRTPLWWAAKEGREAIVKLLLKTGKVEIDLKDNNGRTPLFQAALNGHKATFKLLLETGKVEIDLKDNNGRTPLSQAALNGHKATVELLLETGKVEVDSKDNNGLTPLWWAALNRHEAIVKLLLETGKVEVDSKDNLGQTPLL